MIVQRAAEGDPHFVIAMNQHTAFAGSLSRNFGNDTFAGLEPAEPMQYIVDHHDAGWADLDELAPQNPETGLPFNLTATPLPEIISTSAGSPDFNELHHAFSGIISSMHTYGLYHGRYGLSDKVFIDAIPADLRPAVDDMLANELSRQERLGDQLSQTDPAHASDEFLFHAYKQLQFFDTLSLHLHLNPEGQRGNAEFHNVPRSAGDDVTVSLVVQDSGVYALSPYPFRVENLELFTEGRYVTPQPVGTDLASLLSSIEIDRQHVRFVAA